MDTPEFLLWALEYSCPIRGFQDGSDPERTERHLRAARAAGDAALEGRVFEGLCVSPPSGFRIADALAIYGGLSAIEQACRDCPANALAQDVPGQLAGCYGLVPLPEDPSSLHRAIERGIEAAYPRVDWSTLCIATTPRWYGLWIESPVEAELLLLRYLVLQAATIDDQVCRTTVAELLTALNVAFDSGCRLHVQLYPPGRVEGTWWRLMPHCPRCKARWNDTDLQCCRVCGSNSRPGPDKKRKARGRRPYFPLGRLLGDQAAADFLIRYVAFRKQSESISPAQNPPRDELQDSPPAD